MQEEHGIVFDVKHFAVHDGPGIRTTVFLKGCPLRCLWCHSPESQSLAPEIMIHPERCIGCKACVKACPQGALKHPGDPEPAGCTHCGACAQACYSGARVLLGASLTVEEVMISVRKDKRLHEASGGGVTISGGEPTHQPGFTYTLLQALKEEGYHTALDTCGCTTWETLKRMLPLTDLFLYDLKHLDPDTHRRLTGRDNDLILSNLRRLSEMDARVVVRVPLIPGLNDSEEHLKSVEGLLRGLNVEAVEILPYHRLGVPKYESLGRRYTLADLEPHSEAHLLRVQEHLRANGLNVVVEGLM
ncbi:MAG: glycyl-radical enzyme activating protein [Candidatus Bathyarchaeota archaeon]